MTIQSMTGYGKAEISQPDFLASVELKSVNNRFLDVQIKGSRLVAPLEPKLRKVLAEFVSRGSVTCYIQYESNAAEDAPLQLNVKMLEAYLAISRQVAGYLDSKELPGVAELLQLPDLVSPKQSSPDAKVLEERILPLFRQACEDFKHSREAEGRRLVGDLVARAETLSSRRKKLVELIPDRQKEYHQKLRSRVQEIVGDDIRLIEDRVITELGILAERQDVTEELVRLESHISLFKETLDSHSSPGKKLGFILQELLREVNTLGTKSQYSDMVHICVGLKEELEIIREQALNLE